jgi:hypothetical protein
MFGRFVPDPAAIAEGQVVESGPGDGRPGSSGRRDNVLWSWLVREFGEKNQEVFLSTAHEGEDTLRNTNDLSMIEPIQKEVNSMTIRRGSW